MIKNSLFNTTIGIVVLIFSLPLLSSAQERVFELNSDNNALAAYLRSKDVIVVGEMHGTEEVPNFFLQLVKMMHNSNHPLQVALEISIDLQKDIDGYMQTGDFSKLLTLPYFQWPDGRSSKAMGELLSKLREMKINVFCFDIEWTIQHEVNRDSLMGVNLANSYDNGRLLVLTGNLHATLKDGFWKPGFRSASLWFKEIEKLSHNQIVSLNTYFNGGALWNCMNDGCRERDAFAFPELQQKYGFKDFVVINDQPDGNGYHGFVFFDKVKASKPLVKK